jgi:hypothetical protein
MSVKELNSRIDKSEEDFKKEGSKRVLNFWPNINEAI